MDYSTSCWLASVDETHSKLLMFVMGHARWGEVGNHEYIRALNLGVGLWRANITEM